MKVLIDIPNAVYEDLMAHKDIETVDADYVREGTIFMEIVRDLSIKNAYDMPSFWIKNRTDYRVIPTKYHKGYMQALEDVEKKAMEGENT